MNKYELEVDDLNIHNTLLEDKLNNKEYLSSIIRLIKILTIMKLYVLMGNGE